MRVGRARFRARVAFLVDANVQRCDRTERRIDDEGDGHGIEECGSLLAPLVVEEREGVGERSAVAEKEGALDLVHF